VLGAPWLVPVGVAVVVSHGILPAKAGLAPACPSIRVAAGLGVLTVALTVLLHNGGFDQSDPILMAAALSAEVKQSDWVLVLEDRHLDELTEHSLVDGEVSAAELGTEIAGLERRNTRLFLVAEDDDMARLPPRCRSRFRIERLVKVGFETYYILRYGRPAHPVGHGQMYLYGKVAGLVA